MKTDLNHSHQVRARALRHTGFAPSGAAPLASSARCTRSTHPETVPDTRGDNPECGMTPIPIPEAIARAAMLLRSLSVVTNALRLNRV